MGSWASQPLSSSTTQHLSIGIFLHPVPATWEHRSCAVLTESLLHPAKTLQRENAQLPNIAKENWLISPKILYPAATKKEAKLIQFRTFYSVSAPGNTRKHWSSVSGQHHLSFHENTEATDTTHKVTASVWVPLCSNLTAPPTPADHSSSLFVHRWKMGTCSMGEAETITQEL